MNFVSVCVSLYKFMKEFGIFDTIFWKTVLNNKYLVYIVILLVVELGAFFYAIDQAHIRLHREALYIQYIEELERAIGENKIKGAPDEPIN